MFFRVPEASPDLSLVRAVQQKVGSPSVVVAARTLSFFGEHAAGWLAIGAVGAIIDKPRRREWCEATALVAASHALSIVVKQVVRRPRPAAEGVHTFASTHGKLSFPSSHAASTTTAALVYGRLAGLSLAPVLVPPMALSRLVLGVHYPTDVLAGSALGALVAGIGPQRLRRTMRQISSSSTLIPAAARTILLSGERSGRNS